MHFLLFISLLFSHIVVFMCQDQPDIYVYAYSWTPGFCYKQTYPGCVDSIPYWRTNLIIHGLWPQYAVNGYPSSCTTEPFDNSIPQQIGEPIMIERWPDVQYTVDSSSYNKFWEHEWTKHGTCSGLSQLEYFNNALAMVDRIPTPDVLQQSIGKNMSAGILREHMGGSQYVVLQCNQQILNGIYTCWNQQDHVPSIQIPCPKSVLSEDTCVSSDEIIILSL